MANHVRVKLVPSGGERGFPAFARDGCPPLSFN